MPKVSMPAVSVSDSLSEAQKSPIAGKSPAQGLAFCYKAPDITSFSYLGALKRACNTRKVGHTGTLDKFATGMLIALVGPWTKLGDLFSGLDKVYEATFIFGEERSTLDPEGEVVREADVPTWAAIEEVLPQFRGRIMQVPPKYSAVHVGGTRAYQLAHSGKDVEIPAREIEIYSLEVLAWESPRLTLRIHCSKGTYIRSIARDLARAAGSAAYVEHLHRSQVGGFVLSDFVTEQGDFVQLSDPELLTKLPGVALFEVDESDMVALRVGQFRRYRDLPDHHIYNNVVLCHSGQVLAALHWSDEKRWSFRFVAVGS